MADTKLSIITLGLGLGSFLSSMFGMNLLNHFEGNDFGFVIVFVCTTLLSLIIMISTIIHFQRTNVIPK